MALGGVNGADVRRPSLHQSSLVALDVCPETANHKRGDLWLGFHSGPTLGRCH